MRSTRTTLFIGLLGIIGSPICEPLRAQTSGVPVVVAVDTSRSLTPTALGEVVDRLRLALEALPEETRTGLLAFDDQPRWIHQLDATPRQVAAALAELTPRGDYTLLHDALFVATRELGDGGVVLLATDGRDENSATTVEDIARRSEAQSVRIVALGTGGRVEVRALRRLALVTNGAYLGRVDAVDAATVADAVAKARQGVKADRAASPPPAAAVPEQPSPVPVRSPEPQNDVTASRPAPPRNAWLGWTALLLAATLLIMTLAGLALWRRDRKTEPDFDPHYGVEADPSDEAAEALRRQLLTLPTLSNDELREVTGDTAVFQLFATGEPVEKTQILVESNIVVVREPGEDLRSYDLRADQAFAVGRVRDGNTLSLPDPALSSQHFRIVPADGRHYFIDLGSTNGSSINGQRVDGARELHSGDVIRAGLAEFEFKSNTEHLRRVG